MNTTTLPQEAASHLPPIVLFADEDTARLERHSTYMESSGIWVAVQKEPGRVLDDVLDLRPDAIVTALHFHGQPLGRDVVQLLKSRPDTRDMPIVLLGDNTLAPRMAEHADACVEPKVTPNVLLDSVRALIRSRELRERADNVRRRADGLIERSTRLIARAQDINTGIEHLRRACPRCGRGLEWIERGLIDGREFDYYHWCANGCGLHCFDRASASWLKLAG